MSRSPEQELARLQGDADEVLREPVRRPVGPMFHECRVERARRCPIGRGCSGPDYHACFVNEGGCGALAGEPCRVSRPPTEAPAPDLAAIRIDAIRAREKAATPGPWIFDPEWDAILAGDVTIVDLAKATDSDAAFMANAREDIPVLLAAIDQRDTEIARLQRAVDDLQRQVRP